MPKFKLKHHDNIQIISLYRLSWPVNAIVKKLAEKGIDVTWGAVKKVIRKYQQGKIGYEHLDTVHLPSSKTITDSDINHVKIVLTENPTNTSTDLMHILAQKGTRASKSTVRKVIDGAGFTATVPRYDQMVRNVNKEKRVRFAEACIANDDKFNDVIFTNEFSVQLHDNKIAVYRLKDSVAPLIPMPKHPYKVNVWTGISRRGTTSILIFDGIMKSSFYIDSILTLGLLSFIKRVFPDRHRLQQDNDPKHTAKLTQQFMKSNEINWPSESPDFNPIEMVWSMMKSRLSKMEPNTKEDLQNSIRQFWREQMTIDVCNNFIDRVYKVLPIAAVIGGRATGDLSRKIFPERSINKSLKYFADKLKTEEYQQKISSLQFH